MGHITCPELVAAVSDAGALGCMGMTGRGENAARVLVERTRALTSKPFAANFVLAYPTEPELSICIDRRVPIISLFWGNPAPFVSRIKNAGAKLLVTVGSVDEARRCADLGTDVIVAQGFEAGGHVRGVAATMPLVPRIVDEVSPIPVIAAGGIADGRGLAAALALGAQGAWIGTRFLAAVEADVHPHYRQRLLDAASTDTYFTTLYDVDWPDAPGRVLRNTTIDAWEKAGFPPRGSRPGEGEIVAAQTENGYWARRYEVVTAQKTYEGDIEALPLWAGQSVGLVKRIQPASEIVSEIAAEAANVIGGLAASARL
jgi:NAD(P)H-dependent flavin oxidoreductase YrpB (nitropropane dioxygenase family)